MSDSTSLVMNVVAFKNHPTILTVVIDNKFPRNFNQIIGFETLQTNSFLAFKSKAIKEKYLKITPHDTSKKK